MYKWPSCYQVDFSKPPMCYWSNITKMDYLQRRIIVYSIMYYEHSESCVSDKYFDGISYQLVDMIKQYGLEQYRQTTYYYAMHNFDATTGFDVPSKLTKYDRAYLSHIAAIVHEQWVRDGKQIVK